MSEETGSQRPWRAGIPMARDDFGVHMTARVRRYSLSTLSQSYSLVKKKVSACSKEIPASARDAFVTTQAPERALSLDQRLLQEMLVGI